jgi:hypothetical protein
MLIDVALKAFIFLVKAVWRSDGAELMARHL